MPSLADIFKRFPIVAALLVGPVAPLYAVFNSLPFGGFLVFLALSFGSRQPDKLSTTSSPARDWDEPLPL